MHRATPEFWLRYGQLPEDIRRRADRSFAVLKENPKHPFLRFKKVGYFWSTRVGRAHRALAVRDGGNFVWVWIGSHDDYDEIIRRRQ